MNLDIKAFKTPTKLVKIEGFLKTVTIYPIAGFGIIKLKNIIDKLNKLELNIELQEKLARLALKYGAKASDLQILFLILNCLTQTMALTKEIILFSVEYLSSTKDLELLSKKK